jgi:cell wall-associated NlpC family hydrolase
MTQPPAWVSCFIGIPFLARGRSSHGYDCWGLVRAVLTARFDVAVPSYAEGYDDIRDHGRLAALVEAGKVEWSEVKPGDERPGDVLLLRLRGLPIHVGLLVAPGWMLHTREATGSILERFDGLAWGRRVLGIYRHL